MCVDEIVGEEEDVWEDSATRVAKIEFLGNKVVFFGARHLRG